MKLLILRKQHCLFIITLFLTMISPASFAKEDNVHDPLERFNRAMFKFNETLDVILFRPVATLYNKIMPRPLNRGIHNAFANINTIPTIANDILQLHFYQMSSDFWRLLINSTIGVGGLFDVAGRMGLKLYENDFGLTLARYGWVDSTYLVLPLFGPNSIRDTIEIPVDYYAFSIYPWIKDRSIRYTLLGLAIVDKRAQLLKFESVLDEVAFDKYIFVRNAYLQRRTYQITENRAQRFLQKARPVESMPLPVEPLLTATDQ